MEFKIYSIGIIKNVDDNISKIILDKELNEGLGLTKANPHCSHKSILYLSISIFFTRQDLIDPEHTGQVLY